MFEIPSSNEPGEPFSEPSGGGGGGESFQTADGSAEPTSLTPTEASSLDAEPERLPNEASEEAHEAPATTEYATSREQLEHPVHVTICDIRGEPLPTRVIEARLARRGVWLPRQARMMEDEKQLINTAREGFKDMARATGVDISGNAPAPSAADYSAYHPYPIAEALQDDMQQVYGQHTPEAVQALQHPEIGIMYTQESPVWAPTLARMTVRDMSRQVQTDVDPQGEYPEGVLLSAQSHGYYPDGALLSAHGLSRTVYEDGQLVTKGEVLNDLAVDVAAVRLDQPYQWQRDNPYAFKHILAAAVLDEAVRRQGMDKTEMEDALVRGLVTDDHTVEQVIADSFGPEQLDLLMRMTDHNAYQVERELMLNHAIRSIRAYATNKPGGAIDIYPWRGEHQWRTR